MGFASVAFFRHQCLELFCGKAVGVTTRNIECFLGKAAFGCTNALGCDERTCIDGVFIEGEEAEGSESPFVKASSEGKSAVGNRGASECQRCILDIVNVSECDIISAPIKRVETPHEVAQA